MGDCRRWKFPYYFIRRVCYTLSQLYLIIIVLFLQYATKIKTKVIPDENVLNNIEKNVYNPKNHPGLFKPRLIPIPDAFISAVTNVTAGKQCSNELLLRFYSLLFILDFPVKALIEDGKTLANHLRGKRPPLEKDELKRIQHSVYSKVLEEHQIPDLKNEEDQAKFQQIIDNKVNNILRSDVYRWKPVNFTSYEALVYLMSRSAAEFSVLAKIFLEISERDPEFKPRSLFDFGSGVGTVTW